MNKKIVTGSIGVIILLLLAGVTPLILAQETTDIILPEISEASVNDDELPFGCGFLLALMFTVCVLNPYSFLCKILMLMASVWCNMETDPSFQDCPVCP